MKRPFQLISVLTIGIVLGIVLGTLCSRTVPKSRTVVATSLALNDNAAKQFIIHRVKAIEWATATGSVSTYRVGPAPASSQYITLVGRTSQSLPDDHGSTTLAVLDVVGGKAIVAYLLEFDHGAFGKNLVTVDCRVVEIDVTESAP